jgi:hypothetical protein
MENKKVWGYTSTHKRFFGLMPKSKFIQQVAELDKTSKNWVAQRLCDTGNLVELEKARTTPNKLFEEDR